MKGIAKEKHWSLISPQKQSSAKNIDEFIEKKLAQKGLRHSEEASRRTLIRRVYLDMLGLIPTPEEVEAFVSDEKRDAYEQLLEKVLENPSYGERWAVIGWTPRATPTAPASRPITSDPIHTTTVTRNPGFQRGQALRPLRL